jgi:hypothetical protein
MQLIEDIFRDNTIEELRKEYQGATILQQLLCIEKSLKVLIDNKASKKEHEAELKKHGKNMEPLDLNRKRKETLKLEQDELKKQERENQLKAKLGNKNKRRDMGRTFIQEAEEVAPEEEGDIERELHEKYFT